MSLQNQRAINGSILYISLCKILEIVCARYWKKVTILLLLVYQSVQDIGKNSVQDIRKKVTIHLFLVYQSVQDIKKSDNSSLSCISVCARYWKKFCARY